MSTLGGQVQTVRGPVHMQELGYMLPCQDLLWDPVGESPLPGGPATDRESGIRTSGWTTATTCAVTTPCISGRSRC